ncbi:cbb3-type cytochrome c oxidase subunit 3 [Sulfitobacter sp. D35]|uniref:cbb3-type cytochrome c oxidase subunit 3 n=1 Tax=Sulfitobacter sp. D35 TaxID=3083252 RepID=UPI00296FC8AC|nr:cbb3-type cytochrome c oxidase subunit 3 [Sulfitobacter sp. D35]MDW4498563.1 cbb3-type cytochrome c oxidase subunit 3 [Sulfitobacter sp. D35]
MDTYSLLRQIADSWVLLALLVFFLGTVAWAFRPGSRRVHDEISQIPLNDDAPRPDGAEATNRERTGDV